MSCIEFTDLCLVERNIHKLNVLSTNHKSVNSMKVNATHMSSIIATLSLSNEYQYEADQAKTFHRGGPGSCAFRSPRPETRRNVRRLEGGFRDCATRRRRRARCGGAATHAFPCICVSPPNSLVGQGVARNVGFNNRPIPPYQPKIPWSNDSRTEITVTLRVRAPDSKKTLFKVVIWRE
jgi:hypothetical protein